MPAARHLLLLSALLAACAPRPASHFSALSPPQTTTDEPPLLVANGDKILRVERHRPLKPGDQYDIEAHSIFNAQVKMPVLLSALITKGSRLESGEKHFDVAGRVAIVSLDPAGKPAALTFTVKTCIGPNGELLPANTIIDAKASPTGMTCTRRDGTKISREANQALLGLFNQEKSAAAAPRAKDGSDIPHKIGETWPAETPPTLTRGVGEGSKVTFRDIHAWTTLKSMTARDRIDALEVESGFKGTMYFDKLPWGFTAKPAELHATQTTLLPLDPALPPLDTSRHIDAEIQVEGSFLLIPVSADVKVKMDQKITPARKTEPTAAHP